MTLAARKVHMIGIGGIGMSGLAFMLINMGARITGSDLESSEVIKKLTEKGAIVSIGHKASNINDQDMVVYSSSIRRDNPEILAALDKKIKVIPRTELLRMVMGGYRRSVAITGTHGKTTITAMVSLVLEEAGADPTVLIGGYSSHFGGNAKFGKGDIFVTEMDESDGRFVSLKPAYTVIANLEREHAEYYRDEKHLVDTFGDFLEKQPTTAYLFYRFEDRNLSGLAGAFRGRIFSFGFTEEADLYARNVKTGFLRIDFDCFCRKKKLGRFTINIPGIHNVLNALATILLTLKLGVDIKEIKYALSSYKGVKRRFEIIGSVNGAKVVEDYAHHPTEIKATIEAARSLKPKRLITIFQPHRYTRTKSLYKEFSASFAGSSEVVLTDVYPASEDEIEDAGVKRIYDVMRNENSVPVKILEKEKIPDYVLKTARAEDIVLVLGAGDIGKAAHEILEKDKRKSSF